MCDTSKEKTGGRSGGPPGNDWIIFPKVLVTQDSLLSFIWLSAAFKVAKWVMPKVVQAAEWFREGRTDGSVSIVWKKANYLSLFLGFQTVRVGTVGTPVGTITLSCAYRINLAFMSTRWGKSLGIQQNSSKKKKGTLPKIFKLFFFQPLLLLPSARPRVQRCHCWTERTQFPEWRSWVSQSQHRSDGLFSGMQELRFCGSF